MATDVADRTSASGATLTIDLVALAAVAETLAGVRRRDVIPGDRLLIATRNSIYSLLACADGSFLVSGGWVARQGVEQMRLAVNGCTAGGRALFTDLVAAPRLFIEFAGGTTTTRVRSVRRIAPRTTG